MKNEEQEEELDSLKNEIKQIQLKTNDDNENQLDSISIKNEVKNNENDDNNQLEDCNYSNF